MWGLCNLESKQLVTDFLEIFNIYVELYIEKYYNNGKKFKNGEEVIIMLGLEKEELSELAERSEIVMRYKKLVDKVNEDKSLFKWFSQEEERKMYEAALIKQSKKDGILSVAKKMLDENMSIDLISKLTNLSEKQINKL